MDLGAKAESGRIMCVAAALFEPWYYDAFLHEWQPILDGWNAKALHATDFFPGGKRPTGDFRRTFNGVRDKDRWARFERDRRRIPEIVAATVRQLFIVTVREDEYEAVAPQNWREQFGDVRRIAVQLMADRIGHWANREKYKGEIAYFYELGPKSESKAYDALRDRCIERPASKAHMRMASTPIGVEKGKAHGLEISDYLAWHWTKYAVESMDVRKRPILKDIWHLMELLKQRGKKIDVRFVTGGSFEEFLISHGCKRRKGAKPSAFSALPKGVVSALKGRGEAPR